jgi:hypothetical protein
MRKVDEIKADIDVISDIAEKISRELNKRYPDRKDNSPVVHVIKDIDFGGEIDQGCARQVAFWLYHGMSSLFLQDADALVLRTGDLVDILNYVRKKFPTIERITTYSRAQTVSRKTPEELRAIRQAGLNRIHIGLETGADEVLALVNKGVTQEEQIRAGRNVVDAGFELSQYFMPGLGGNELTDENAVESAMVLNQVNPTFIRIRSTIPVPGTPLHDMMEEGRWTPLTEEEKVREIRLFIEKLEGITSTVQSDHIMNLLEDVEGTLPGDKERLLKVVDTFLEMGLDDRESFIVGRRIGRYRYLADYVQLFEVENIKREIIRQYGSVDRGILEILTNFI